MKNESDIMDLEGGKGTNRLSFRRCLMVSERMAPTRYVLAAISQDATTNKQLVIDLAKSASLTVKVTREMSLSADQKTELHKRNPALAKVFDW